MYARLVTAQFQPTRIDDALRTWQERVLPRLEQQQGFQGLTLYLDRATSQMVVAVHYDTHAAMVAGQAGMRERIAPLADFLVSPPTTVLYEVALQQ